MSKRKIAILGGALALATFFSLLWRLLQKRPESAGEP